MTASSAAALAVFECADLCEALAPWMCCQLDTSELSLSKPFPRPTPLLGLTKRTRELYRKCMQRTGVLRIHTPIGLQYVLVPYDQPLNVSFPYEWQVYLHNSFYSSMRLSPPAFVPCHKLWFQTLRVDASWKATLPRESQLPLYFLHDGSTDVRDLDDMIFFHGLGPSVQYLYYSCICPLDAGLCFMRRNYARVRPPTPSDAKCEASALEC